MRRDIVAATLCGVAGSILAACGGSPASSNANVGVCGGQTGSASADTAKYIVVLVTGPPESSAPSASPSASAVPSPSASATAAPGSPGSPGASPSAAPGSEDVLSGALADVSGPGATHLELHICDRSTGAVVSDVRPAVTLQNISSGAPGVALPVAVMEGAGAGMNDLHYGNNVKLAGGDAYAITVHIDSTNVATLDYSVPAASPSAKGSPQPDCMSNHQLC